jgi:hypothetical protein
MRGFGGMALETPGMLVSAVLGTKFFGVLAGVPLGKGPRSDHGEVFLYIGKYSCLWGIDDVCML